jgi:hypothetical protein
MNIEDLFLEVSSQSHMLSLDFSSFFQIEFGFLILQTLFSHSSLFIKVLDGSSLVNGKFLFSSPSDEFVNNNIDVCGEDVFYNWMNRASMSISKVGMPFKVAKEMHLVMI